MFSEDVQAYAAITVYVGMIYFGCEVEFWWFERVVGRELYVQEKYTALVWAVSRSYKDKILSVHVQKLKIKKGFF